MKRVLIALVRFYQVAISAHRPACCKYSPTCSAYAIEALQVHGALKGTGMALWRILRCNPWSRGGWDPVPEKRERRKSKTVPVEVPLPQERLSEQIKTESHKTE